MFELTAAELLAGFGKLWWPFLRIGGAFMMLPILGYPLLPIRVRLLLALMVAFLASGLMPAMPVVDPFSIGAILFSLEQIMLGAMLSIFPICLIQVLVIVGELLSMQMGLSMARMNDPINGMAVPILASFYSTLALLLYLSLDGHLILLEFFIESFHVLPVGNGLLQLNWSYLINAFSWLLSSGLLLSLPAMFAMYLVNFIFGVLSKVAPSLNIFALGFPMAMLCGLFCILITFSGLPKNFIILTQQSLTNMRMVLGS